MKDMKFTQFCSGEEINLIPTISDQYHDAPRAVLSFSARLKSVMTEVDQQLIQMTEDDRRDRTGRGYFATP